MADDYGSAIDCGDGFSAEPIQLAPYQPQPKPHPLLANIDKANLCDQLDDSELAKLGAKVIAEYKADLTSREKEGWTERNKSGLKLAMQVKETKSYPWPNASNVKHPVIAEAAIQFNARAYPAIVDGAAIVKGKVLGEPSPEKQQKADRIGRHMSYQLIEEDECWEPDTDRLLIVLPIVGSVFRKTWFDPVRGHNRSSLLTPDKLVQNYWAKDDCPRQTEIITYYPHQIEEKIRAGTWRKVELGEAKDAGEDDQAPHTFLEQHRLYDMDEDGYPEPYIVTVHEETEKVVRVVARYDEDGLETKGKKVVRIKPVDYYTKYDFLPSLDGSYLGTGLGALLEPLNETINSTLNQLMDAGHLANVQGGFIGAGVSIKSGNLRFQPGEFKRVEVNGGTLRDGIVPFVTKEPSAVLFNLLGLLIESAKDIAATKDILTGDTASANQPVGTTLAAIEQGMKVFTAIFKRVHRALKGELKKRYRLNRLYLKDQSYFQFQDSEEAVARQDYDDETIDVVPVTDPTVVTDMQRLGRAQFVMQYLGNPNMDDGAIIKRSLEAAQVADVKELFAKEQQADPQAALEGMKLELQKQDNQSADMLRQAQAEQAQAAARKTTAEVEAMMPGASPALAQLIQTIIEQTLQASNGQVQQGQLPGMDQPPPDADLPPIPEGPPVDAGPEMGGGGQDGPGEPGERDVLGGAFEPQV